MNEVDWLTGHDPQAMLDYQADRVSDRRLRLFAVACCRRFWPYLKDPRSRRAVEVSERYAEGDADGAALAEARAAAELVAQLAPPIFEEYAYQAAVAAAGEFAA